MAKQVNKANSADKSKKKVINIAALRQLQELWYQGETGFLKYSVIENLGFNMEEEHIEIGNFVLKQYTFPNHYNMSLIDKTKDLNGKPIDDNVKAIKFIQSAWKDDNTEIEPTDLQKFALNTKLNSFTIGNFNLSIGLFSRNYTLSLKDKERGIDNRVIDEYVTVQRVLKDVKSYSTEGTTYYAESSFEESLYDYLALKYENVHRQVSIGGVKSLKIDLDIGNGKVGIELKIADKVTRSAEKQRLIGQLHDYTEKKYRENNLIVAVTGESKYEMDISIKEVEKLVKNQYRCYFVFIGDD